MIKVYKKTDRIKVNIDGLTFSIAPLTLKQKKEIQSHLYKASVENDLVSAQDASVMSLKYSVKNVKGLYDLNEEEYQLQFDENGNLSDESIDDLLNIEQNTKLAVVWNSLVNGVSHEIIDPMTEKPMKGISFGESEKKN